MVKGKIIEILVRFDKEVSEEGREETILNIEAFKDQARTDSRTVLGNKLSEDIQIAFSDCGKFLQINGANHAEILRARNLADLTLEFTE